MPHVVIDGQVDLARFAREFTPLLVRRGGDVLRVDRVYLEQGARELLAEALVVEARRKLSFYVRISAHERGSATVRIDPLTHPDRSEGVRELVACVARALLRHAPGCRIARGNLGNLVIPSPPAEHGGDP